MDKYLIAVCTPIPTIDGPRGPRREPVTVEWHRARQTLGFPTNSNYMDMAIDGKEVGEARNAAVEMTLEHKPRPEFLFFLDYDVIPQSDAISKLVYRARCFPDYDIFAGVYCCKSSPPDPLIYKGDGGGSFWDWTLGDLLTDGITGTHMGLTLIRTSLFERMDRDKPLFLTQRETKTGKKGGVRRLHGTEDLYFCKRAREEVGAKILVDTSVLAGHIQNATGEIFGLPLDSPPIRRSRHHNNGDTKEDEGEEKLKYALDLGAGNSRREWPGYKTETTDIRPDVGADHVMDTRLLNFPDESYDLVASSHHLEHLGRWDQEKAWSEMYRVLKPGGRMEHMLPNLEWAARKLSEGGADTHVYNVLYGAQEAHGYERDYNVHYFGYTPDVARAMAEEVGLVDIEIRTWLDEPDLAYNLVLSARKPEEESESEEEGQDESETEKTNALADKYRGDE